MVLLLLKHVDIFFLIFIKRIFFGQHIAFSQHVSSELLTSSYELKLSQQKSSLLFLFTYCFVKQTK